MKKKKKIINVIIFLLILSICIGAIYNVTKLKYSYQKMRDFFIQKEDFDVLFFGSSHVLNGIVPMELWENYGLVSYNMGIPEEYMPLTYYNMLLSLEKTNLKLIVIDTYMINYDEKMSNPMMPHKTLDAYPLSYKKYLAVKDLFNNNDLLNREVQYLFNFSIYHTRWNELTEEDFKDTHEYIKGARTNAIINDCEKLTYFDSINVYDKKETTGMIYLRKIIEYCQNNNIEVLLTYLPARANPTSISISKYVKNIANEYNINYINFLNMDLVDNNIDFFDEWAHLNPSGGRKVTNYLGKYIVENYNITNQKNNAEYNFWYQDYNEYIDYKIKSLEYNLGNLDNFLMLLYNENDIKYEIRISSKKKIEEGSRLQKLLKNINNNYVIDDKVFEHNNDKTVKINLYDSRDNHLIKTVWF